MAKQAAKRAPWDRKNPRKTADKSSTHLTSAQKATAKRRAKRAGRSYPNLVDNMRVASESRGRKKSTKKSSTKAPAAKKNTASKKTTSKKSTAKKTASKNTSASKKTRSTSKTSSKKAGSKKGAAKKRKRILKNPQGGLTAAGRTAFRKSEGAHLKPGVRKRVGDMTPEDMRRKGSWAVRFYGREKLPALKDKDGNPTRFALTAHAWGEPVPRTISAARKIAAKGRKLLAQAKERKRA